MPAVCTLFILACKATAASTAHIHPKPQQAKVAVDFDLDVRQTKEAFINQCLADLGVYEEICQTPNKPIRVKGRVCVRSKRVYVNGQKQYSG